MSWFASLFRPRSARRRSLTPFQTCLALHMALAQPPRRFGAGR